MEDIRIRHILYITNYPAPYRVDFFNELGKCPQLNLTVLFLETPKEQKDRDVSWFHENYTNFKGIFLSDKKRIPKIGYVYKDIKKWLSLSWDEIIFGGYSYPTFMYGMRYLQKKGIPYSMEIDGGLIKPDSYLEYKIKSKFLSSASQYYSTGHNADYYLTHYGADINKIRHYPFTSQTEADLAANRMDSPTRQEARQMLNIPEKQVIIAVGRFLPVKGHDLLLQAAAQMSTHIGFYIIGGEPTEDYKEFQKQHKLDNVHFVPFQNKEGLAKYYRAADMLVFPTRGDVWGLVVNEAMSFGIPVVSSNMGVAGKELIVHGENGYVFESENVWDMIAKIYKAFDLDSKKVKAFSLNLIRNYTIENMARTHIRYWFDEKH